MKKTIIFFLLTVSVVTLRAQPPQGDANPGDTYGKKITADHLIQLNDFNGQLSKKDTVIAKIKGKVISSCPKKGCWMNVELDDQHTVFVKFKEYAFFVPQNIVGKTVVMDGIAMQKEISVTELKHYAADAKKSKEEIEAITEPQTQIRFIADGVLVIE